MFKTLDKEQILAIAKSRGSFRVTLRWRDDAVRKRCFDLKRAGLLVGGRKILHGAYVFYPATEK